MACIVCDHVINENRDIHLVTHDLDDDQWGFLCGKDDHQIENYKLISLKQVTDIDQSVNELYNLPLGYGADRESITSTWNLFKQNLV